MKIKRINKLDAEAEFVFDENSSNNTENDQDTEDVPKKAIKACLNGLPFRKAEKKFGIRKGVLNKRIINLTLAIQLIKNGILSVTEAEIQFKIPESILLDRLKTVTGKSWKTKYDEVEQDIRILAGKKEIKCRICLITLSGASTSMSEESNCIVNGQFMTYKEIYENVIETDLDFMQNGPLHLCMKCGDDLEAFFKFKKKCEETEMKFKNKSGEVHMQKDDKLPVHHEKMIVETLDEAKIDPEKHDTSDFEALQNFTSDSETDSVASDIKEEEKVKIPCKYCEKTFPTKIGVSQHIRLNHPNEKIACSVENCDFTCLHESQMLLHKKRIHDIKQKYEGHKCKKCNEIFPNIILKREHMKKVHPYQKDMCPQCGKMLEYGYLNEHLKTHGEINPKLYRNNPEKYKCDLCGYSSTDFLLLTKHIKRHLWKIKFVCMLCHNIFSTKRNCRAHQRRMHLDLPLESRPVKQFINNDDVV